ncbi:hypothetical protein [Marimonas arenosa]|uniref:Uncharacterized protein n=1 Tax=Marimonas arenosa TaxID=1795305 RepID=A0AAE3WDK8_9RHOB|nr:hypothetical protein [Marimonas arenosa]MDQ2090563.1 hypothetical protein [Marimonas arenosa]
MSRLLDDLAAVTDAAYRADLAGLKSIVAEEDELRRNLANLAAEERRSATADPDRVLALNQIGGDILWRAWVGRKREALNLRLATVIARKLAAAQAVLNSFGRSSIAEDLRRQAGEKHRSEQATRRTIADQTLMTLTAGRTRPGIRIGTGGNSAR